MPALKGPSAQCLCSSLLGFRWIIQFGDLSLTTLRVSGPLMMLDASSQDRISQCHLSLQVSLLLCLAELGQLLGFQGCRNALVPGLGCWELPEDAQGGILLCLGHGDGLISLLGSSA